MRIWTLIKIIAALVVLGVMAFTGMLAYHITVKPLGGVFAKIIPDPADVVSTQKAEDVDKMLDASEMPDIEPGEKAYQKAIELIATGSTAEAREKLESIVNIYPSSSTASEARRIVGEMNLDEVLSADHMEGKSTYIVKPGDAYNSIANKSRTNLDCLMHLNGLTDLARLQPGDDLIFLPLDYRILIEPQKKFLSLWSGGKFIKDYPIVRIEHSGPLTALRTTIDSRAGFLDGKKILPGGKGYLQSEKILQLAKSPLQIRPMAASSEGGTVLPRGVYLKTSDMEELNLLTRPGNEVEIRLSPR